MTFDAAPAAPNWYAAGQQLDVRAEFQIGGTWTDLTSRCFDVTTTIQRGHPDESTTAAPSVFSGTFDNHDGVMSNLNPLSPYYGKLGLNTPVRVSVPADSAHLRLESDQVSGASAPSVAAFNPSGSFEVWMDASADNWRAPQVLAAKWASSTSQRTWILVVRPDGTVQLAVSANGVVALSPPAVSTAPLPKVHGRLSIRVSVDLTAHTVTFYTGQYCTGWTQLGSAVAAGLSAPYAGTAPVEIGHCSDVQASDLSGLSSLPGFNGRIYAAAIVPGIGAAVTSAAASPDFTAQTPGATSFRDAQGVTWTLQGSAEISSRDYRFHGEAASWPQSWTPGDPNARIALEAGGLLRRMGASNASVQSPMRRAFTRTPPAGLLSYWPAEDGSNATQVASGLQSGAAMRITSGAPSLAANSDFACSSPVLSLNGAVLLGTPPAYTPASSPGSRSDAIIRWLMSVPSGGDTDGGCICSVLTTGGSITRLDLRYSQASGALTLNAYNAGGALMWTSAPQPFAVNGQPVRASLEIRNQGSGNYGVTLATLTPGASSALTWTSTSASGSVGRVARITFNAPPFAALSSTAIGHISFQATYTPLTDMANPLIAWAGEAAGARFARLCAEEGIQFRGIGNIADTVPMGAQTVETLATLVQECADADRGMWFEGRQFLGWGYRTRVSLGNQPPVIPLDYNQDHLSDALEPTVDDQTMKNDITVTSQNAGSSSRQVLDDGSPNSVSIVGRHDAELTINTAQDSQLDSETAWILHTLTVNEPRYKAINVDLANSAMASLYWQILEAETGDRITVQNPPAWLPPGLVDQIMQGVTETLGRKALYESWNGVPSRPWNTAHADDPAYGRADTDGSVLASAATSASTSLLVATTTSGSPVWTTASTDMPFDINIGGERITVTAVSGSVSPQMFTVIRSVNGVVKSQVAGADVRLWTPAIVSL